MLNLFWIIIDDSTKFFKFWCANTLSWWWFLTLRYKKWYSSDFKLIINEIRCLTLFSLCYEKFSKWFSLFLFECFLWKWKSRFFSVCNHVFHWKQITSKHRKWIETISWRNKFFFKFSIFIFQIKSIKAIKMLNLLNDFFSKCFKWCFQINCKFMIILKYLHFDNEIKSCLKNFNVIFEFDEKKNDENESIRIWLWQKMIYEFWIIWRIVREQFVEWSNYFFVVMFIVMIAASFINFETMLFNKKLMFHSIKLTL